ncbi:MAG: RNA polymerase sigma factor [Pirellulales bacterium]
MPNATTRDISSNRTEMATRGAIRDEALLVAYRQSDDPALFAELVGRYERELFSYLFRYVGEASLADDIFQATFLQVHLKRDEFDETRRLRPWLYRIATNQAIDALRRDRKHRALRLDRVTPSQRDTESTLAESLESSEPVPTAILEEKERGVWVRDSVARLPEHLRATVDLVFFQGLKYREAADALSIPVGTLKSRMHSALEKLRQGSRQLVSQCA